MSERLALFRETRPALSQGSSPKLLSMGAMLEYMYGSILIGSIQGE
jgi:hypothetical protein